MHAGSDGQGSDARQVLSHLKRRWWAAVAAASLLALQACGGGESVVATERPAAVASVAAAAVAATTATTVATVNLVAPGGNSSYRIEQLSDGTLKVTLSVGDGTTLTGDIRAFYFHMSGDNVGGLTVSGDQVTGVKVAANAVTQAGGPDTKLSRQSGVLTSGGFDVGVDIGTKSSTGADDVQSTVIFVSRPGGLTLVDFRYLYDDASGTPAYLGLVVRSVGAPGTRRSDEINTIFEPVEVVPPPPPPPRVYEVGAAHLCWSDGQLVNCVGDNTYGQSPSFGTSFILAATQVAAGDWHSCALGVALVGGTSFVPDSVACWGEDSTRATAKLPQPALGPVAQIAAGSGTTCALTTAGQVTCWAATTDAGALNGYTVTGIGTVIDLAVGGSRACAVNAAGSVICWNKDKGKPASSVSGTLAFSQIDAFGGVACGTTTAGGAACWGIALATVEPSPPPADLSGVTQVAVGNNFACAVIESGSVTCWATGLTAPAPSVLTFTSGLTDVRSIEAGGDTVCANKRASGEVVCGGAIPLTLFGPLT